MIARPRASASHQARFEGGPEGRGFPAAGRRARKPRLPGRRRRRPGRPCRLSFRRDRRAGQGRAWRRRGSEPTRQAPVCFDVERPDVITRRCRKRKEFFRRVRTPGRWASRNRRPGGGGASGRAGAVQGENALKMERAARRLDAVGRVGEIDQAVGAADNVVGTVEPCAPAQVSAIGSTAGAVGEPSGKPGGPFVHKRRSSRPLQRSGRWRLPSARGASAPRRSGSSR